MENTLQGGAVVKCDGISTAEFATRLWRGEYGRGTLVVARLDSFSFLPEGQRREFGYRLCRMVDLSPEGVLTPQLVRRPVVSFSCNRVENRGEGPYVDEVVPDTGRRFSRRFMDVLWPENPKVPDADRPRESWECAPEFFLGLVEVGEVSLEEAQPFFEAAKKSVWPTPLEWSEMLGERLFLQLAQPGDGFHLSNCSHHSGDISQQVVLCQSGRWVVYSSFWGGEREDFVQFDGSLPDPFVTGSSSAKAGVSRTNRELEAVSVEDREYLRSRDIIEQFQHAPVWEEGRRPK